MLTTIHLTSLCYYIEMDFDSGFTDIPTAFYWVVITIITLSPCPIIVITIIILSYPIIL